MPALSTRRLAAAALLALSLPAAPSAVAAPTAVAPHSDSSPSALCEAAIQRAAASEGVPERLLRAVSLVESGRTRDGERRPWPWTVNMEGESRWFDSRGEALDFVRARRRAGARSFDVGCMQLNHIWHGERFDDLEEMFDPEANVAYAARFLAQLMAETGDWMRAAGYYHSRTPEHFKRYSGLIAAAYEAAKSKPRPAQALRETVIAAPRPAAAPRDPKAALWDGLLRKARAPALGGDGPRLALFANAPPARSAAAATREPRSPARARAGGVALTGLGGGGAPLLRPARPMF